jgi:hypothetical protein
MQRPSFISSVNFSIGIRVVALPTIRTPDRQSIAILGIALPKGVWSCSPIEDPSIGLKCSSVPLWYNLRFGTDYFNRWFSPNWRSIFAYSFGLFFIDWFFTILSFQFLFNLSFSLSIKLGTDWYRIIWLSWLNSFWIALDLAIFLHLHVQYHYITMFKSSIQSQCTGIDLNCNDDQIGWTGRT